MAFGKRVVRSTLPLATLAVLLFCLVAGSAWAAAGYDTDQKEVGTWAIGICDDPRYDDIDVADDIADYFWGILDVYWPGCSYRDARYSNIWR